jgi:hypothetical protein
MPPLDSRRGAVGKTPPVRTTGRGMSVVTIPRVGLGFREALKSDETESMRNS